MGAFVALALTLFLFSCAKSEPKAAQPAPIGDVARGQELITQYGCGSCHTIPGIQGPKGVIGPPLAQIATRPYIGGGKVQNTPEHMILWLQNPQAFDPANTMPNLGVTEKDAHDLAAFLFTLK